jgi:hypothetical protein
VVAQATNATVAVAIRKPAICFIRPPLEPSVQQIVAYEPA